MILFEFIKSGLGQTERCIYVSEEDKEAVKSDFLGGPFADDELVSFDRNHTLVSQDQKEGLIQRITIPTLSRLTRYASD